MPSSPRRARWIRVLVVSAVALAATPSGASAELTLSGAKIDGVTSTSSPPGSVLEARVTGKATGGDRWEGTQYRFGAGQRQCVNTEDSGGDKTVEFDVTAPGVPGSYDAGFTARSTNQCGGAASEEKVLTAGLRVTEPAPNKDLPPRCGINVMLVLDESGSIDNSGQTETVKNATRAFLDALSGTGAKVAIVDFSTKAQRPVDYTTVTPETMTTVFDPYLKNGYKPSGWTNWEAAFQKVRETNAQKPLADLVVFITDGDPTARNNPPGEPVTNLTEGDVTAMRPAAAQADLVKGQGSHVFALGVGAAVTKPASARRLTAVSGFDQFPESPFEEADYTLVKDFDELAEALRQIAIELCQASVTVTKLVDEGDGVYEPDPGWTFTATVSTSPGGYAWVQPPPPPATGPRSAITNEEGVATFQWKPANAGATSTVTLSEDEKPGYEFVDYTCTKNAPGQTRTRVRQGANGERVAVGGLGPNEYAKCTVRNRIIPGTIEIEKEATPQSSQRFAFSGSFGPFTLVDDAGATSSSRIFTGLAPGTYTVRELVPDDWALTGIACSNPAVAITPPEVAITIGPGDSVVCTYQDTRTDPPVPPEPPDPPEPPAPPGPPAPPVPPDSGGVLPRTLASTQLRVVKTGPSVVRVGERVRFRLTVTNVGSVAATDVRMADVPPAALALTSLKTSTRARVIGGSAFWRLGTLAPGTSRTVRGSVRIKSGTPGLKRNLVLATAVNAQLVDDRADTRLLAQETPPAVTG